MWVHMVHVDNLFTHVLFYYFGKDLIFQLIRNDIRSGRIDLTGFEFDSKMVIWFKLHPGWIDHIHDLNPTHSYSPPRLKFALRAYLTCFSRLISTCFVLFPLTQQYLIYQLNTISSYQPNKFFVSRDNERKQLDKWIYPLVHSGSPSSFPKLISIHNELTRHCLCKATPLHMGTFVLIASSRDVVAGKTNHDQRTPCHGASHYCWFPSMELGC
jgi:hypothetical protein